MKHSFIPTHTPFSPHHFATLLQKCLKSKSLNPCKQIHALILTSATNINTLSLHSKLVAVYATCNCFTSTHSMFQTTQNLNIFAYNWTIFALTFNGRFKEAITHFTMLQKSNLIPNSHTFSFLLKSCVGLRDLTKGKEVHCMVNKFGLYFNLSVVNGLIDMYCKCGCLGYARKVFDKMPEPDVVTWTNIISGYSSFGPVQEARFLFERMRVEGLEPNEFTWNALIAGYARVGDCDTACTLFGKMSRTGLVPDVVTYNAMISGFVQNQRLVEAFGLFREMLVARVVRPNPVTLTGLLPAFGFTGSVGSGKEMHGFAYRTNMCENVFVASALIDMYSKCGYVKDARSVFDVTQCKNIASWNAMIGCYGKHGMVNSAIDLLDVMEQEKIQPNEVTLTCVLASCSHSGMVNKGLTLFKSMRERREGQRVEIRDEHYACVVDILCRSGEIEEAYDLVKELGTEVTESMIGAFLNGCVVYKRPDLAKKVGEIVMKMELKRTGGVVTLSNVYAGEGEWGKVEELREVMKLQGVQKEPGFSSVYNNI